MSGQCTVPTSLDNELAALPKYSIRDLRARWRALFRRDPPPAFGPDLLRRSVAQKLQEQAYGGLSIRFSGESGHVRCTDHVCFGPEADNSRRGYWRDELFRQKERKQVFAMQQQTLGNQSILPT